MITSMTIIKKEKLFVAMLLMFSFTPFMSRVEYESTLKFV